MKTLPKRPGRPLVAGDTASETLTIKDGESSVAALLGQNSAGDLDLDQAYVATTIETQDGIRLILLAQKESDATKSRPKFLVHTVKNGVIVMVSDQGVSDETDGEDFDSILGKIVSVCAEAKRNGVLKSLTSEEWEPELEAQLKMLNALPPRPKPSP